jgi:hypothetical protein
MCGAAVPEASVDEHREPSLGKDDVWPGVRTSDGDPKVLSKAKSSDMQCRTKPLLGGGTAASVSPHHAPCTGGCRLWRRCGLTLTERHASTIEPSWPLPRAPRESGARDQYSLAAHTSGLWRCSCPAPSGEKQALGSPRDRTVWDVRSLSTTNYRLYCRGLFQARNLGHLLGFLALKGSRFITRGLIGVGIGGPGGGAIGASHCRQARGRGIRVGRCVVPTDPDFDGVYNRVLIPG